MRQMNTRYIASRCFGAHVLRTAAADDVVLFFPGKYFARDVYTTLLSRRPFFLREIFERLCDEGGSKVETIHAFLQLVCLFFISFFSHHFFLSYFLEGSIQLDRNPSHMMKKKNDFLKNNRLQAFRKHLPFITSTNNCCCKEGARVALNSPSVHVSGFLNDARKVFFFFQFDCRGREIIQSHDDRPDEDTAFISLFFLLGGAREKKLL